MGILKLISCAWISYTLCAIRNYEGVGFWIMYLTTYFAILILFNVYKDFFNE